MLQSSVISLILPLLVFMLADILKRANTWYTCHHALCKYPPFSVILSESKSTVAIYDLLPARPSYKALCKCVFHCDLCFSTPPPFFLPPPSSKHYVMYDSVTQCLMTPKDSHIETSLPPHRPRHSVRYATNVHICFYAGSSMAETAKLVAATC